MSRFTRAGLTLAIVAAVLGVLAVLSLLDRQSILTRVAADQLGYNRLSAAQLALKLEHKNFAFVNVHIPYAGEIEGTDLFIPYNEIAAHLDTLPADKKAEIVLYCQSGRMSAIAAEALASQGYSNVSHLVGGMVSWEQAGYKLVHRER